MSMNMTAFWFLVMSMLTTGSAGAFLGFVVGKERGEDSGYKLGYHEGQFDAQTGHPVDVTANPDT